MAADLTQLKLSLPNAEATEAVGEAIGRATRVGDVICLAGDLGAGKTALARAAIAERLAMIGKAEDIPSPTFTLVQTYQADIAMWHADLYRLSDEDEVWELGLVDAFADAACFIEWADRLGGLTPQRRMVTSLSMAGEGREMTVAFEGENWSYMRAALGEFA